MKTSSLELKNCQIKSAEQFRAVCAALDVLEIQTFVGSGRIRFTNVFICPDIDLMPFYESDKPMERLIGGLAIQLHVSRHGKYAKKKYRKILKKQSHAKS